MFDELPYFNVFFNVVCRFFPIYNKLYFTNWVQFTSFIWHFSI